MFWNHLLSWLHLPFWWGKNADFSSKHKFLEKQHKFMSSKSYEWSTKCIKHVMQWPLDLIIFFVWLWRVIKITTKKKNSFLILKTSKNTFSISLSPSSSHVITQTKTMQKTYVSTKPMHKINWSLACVVKVVFSPWNELKKHFATWAFSPNSASLEALCLALYSS